MNKEKRRGTKKDLEGGNIPLAFAHDARTTSTRLPEGCWLHLDHAGGRAHLSFYPDPRQIPAAIVVFREEAGAGARILLSFTRPEYRRKGLASLLYKHLAGLYGAIISDGEISKGASMLWKALIGDSDGQNPRVLVSRPIGFNSSPYRGITGKTATRGEDGVNGDPSSY